jgi:hypothetical protein
MKRLLREPLLHFFALGALLFGLYGWLDRDGFKAPNEIVVSRGQVNILRAQFERVWQRSPTQPELTGLVANWVREEIFYREGLAMGLDRDDPVVRRRIQQKFEFIVDSATPQAPTDEELQRWLDEHSAAYQQEPTYAVRQIYFDPARHGNRLDADIAAARRALRSGTSVPGDVTMLPAALDGGALEIARTFGSAFEEGLRNLPTDEWQGPVQSGFGLHLVYLTARQPGRNRSLEEVRGVVERDLLHERSEQAAQAFYDRLRTNYSVRIEDADVTATQPAG